VTGRDAAVVHRLIAAAGTARFDAGLAEFERLGDAGCDLLFAARGRPAGDAKAHPRDVAEDLWQAFVVAARRWPDRFLRNVHANPSLAGDIGILDALGRVDRPAARELLVAAATERRAGHALGREYALRSLIRLADPRVPDLLIRLVNDRDSSVRFAAVTAAVTHGDARLLPALRRIAAAERTPAGTRARAEDAIAAIGRRGQTARG
jgi:hypothetical protein